MESRSVSIAWKIMMVPHFVALFFALLFTFFADAVLSMGFEPFTGQSWSGIVSASPKIAEYILMWLRTLGVMSLVVTVYAFAITLMIFRRGERWSWYALLIGATLGWIFDAVAVLIMGIVPVVVVDIIMLLIVYVALGISARDILSKK